MDFSKLMDKDLEKLGRTTDMLWLSIGNPYTIELPYPNGVRKKTVSDYAIHFQCQWRFVKEDKILLASHDIYNPYDNSLEDDDNWEWNIFGRKKEQSSVFDVRSAEFMNEFLPLTILNIYYTDTCDLHIDFDNSVYFDTFITCSTKREYYRLIDFHTGQHTVIFDVD